MYAVLLAAALTAAPDSRVDFDTEIMPIFTKAGCNTGACHGSAKGRGGFRLSLYGSDAASDYDSIVREHEGRRVNVANAQASLLLLKPTESLEHGGGYRLEYGGIAAARLTHWIEQGAPRLKKRKLVAFHVEPSRSIAEMIGTQIPLKATARFDDGTAAEVTRWTVFRPEDDSAVKIDDQTQTATVVRQGRHVVVARFLDRVVPLELIVPLSDEIVDLSAAVRHNFIDDEILATLQTLRLPVSPQAEDGVFLRRIYFDLAGRLPTPREIQQFDNDPRTDRRAQLIDQLLESADYANYWTHRLGKLLRIQPTGRGQGRDAAGADTYYSWLLASIDKNVPFDQVAHALITADGDSHQIGPANFYRTVSGARNQAEFMSELFMASRLRCANCHNHPLDRWTQDDYHGFAALFAKVEQDRIVRLGSRGQVIHPRTGEPARPRIPGTRFLDEDVDGRRAFAEWLTAADNPYFAQATVNRLWKALLGRGLVEPSDDMRQTNLATHPQLLQRLADDFVAHGFDVRHALRRIVNSAAYQRSAKPVSGNESDDRFYARAVPRPLEAEVLADAICDVTDVWESYGDMPPGTRAISLYDPELPSKSLDVLGRCSRQQSCEIPAGTNVGGGLSRKLHLVSGPLLNHKVASAEGRLHQLLSAGKSNDEIIDEFYLRSLTRRPSTKERNLWQEAFGNAATRVERAELLEDFVWSLLSCREFVTK